MWCPIGKNDCKRADCAIYAEGECALNRLHDIANMQEDIQAIGSDLEEMNEIIKNKSFTE